MRRQRAPDMLHGGRRSATRLRGLFLVSVVFTTICMIWEFGYVKLTKPEMELQGSVRLAGGATPCQGRVEIHSQGEWGTVCDDDWGLSDAHVVCRQAGCGHAVTANGHFGSGSGPILLDNVNCQGDEEQLAACYSLGWGVHNCGHHEDAGVICTGGAIRVANGNGSCRGRVELLHVDQWGTVCDDAWDLADAQVACRQLGCGPALDAKVLGYFGPGSGPVLLDNVDCAGNEEQLVDCFHLGWGKHNCGHHEDAGVICLSLENGSTAIADTTELPAEGDVRLVNGTHWCQGRVEVFLKAQWGTVCDDAWDLPEAHVVCRQLGCGEAKDATGEAFFGRGEGVILLDNLKCKGGETSLLECSHITWDRHNCDHSEDASVTCMLW